jgi:HPr kinase/phosphorylase
MAYGCQLVSDDQTILTQRSGGLIATAPKQIQGQIEARGIGILKADTAGDPSVAFVVDMDHKEGSRLPLQRSVTYLGVDLPLIYGTKYANFSAGVLQLLKAGGKSV